LREITVTGSHIRGEVPAGSELKVYSREDLDQSGAATVDQFARLMPQNFSNTDTVSNFSSNANYSLFSASVNNISNSSAFNLHGLGPSATLTLIDGHRVASAGSNGSLVDISLIPLSAVDHIEVLSDGASAIYGTDAVAGVVNIITRKDFNGAETQLRYSGATQGGDDEIQASQLLGRSWSTGNVFLTYEYDKQDGLDASQRPYIASQGGPYSLLPATRRNSVFASGNQTVADNTTVSAQMIYSDRLTGFDTTVAGTGDAMMSQYAGDEKQYGLTLSIDRALSHDWHVSLSGDYSEVLQSWDQNEISSATGVYSQTLDTASKLLGVEALSSGPLFSVPAGTVKMALGTSFRREEFVDNDFVLGQNDPIPASHRTVSSAFIETAVPLIGEGANLPGLRRLSLSAAVRYDDYSDFGPTTNSKLGMEWQPLDGLTVKGTYGTSFQAPLLSQLHTPIDSEVAPLPDPTSPTGVTNTIFQFGGNPNLTPEKSQAFTAGFDVKPALVPNFQLSANYFHIDFDNRIEAPPLIGLDIFTGVLAPFIVRNPPRSAVEAIFNGPNFLGDFTGQGPDGVGAIFSDGYANIATTKSSGVDMNSTYRLPTEYGQFGILVDITRLLRNDFQTIAGAAPYALLNEFGQPPKWKGRGGLTWSQGPFAASAFINYVNAYNNSLFTPAQPIGAWATGDLYFAYKTGNLGAALRNLTVALSVTNITDKRPPTAQIPANDLVPGQNPIPFDPANASPVGRLISLGVTKGWK
jgi:outer membrane receptor protein involved in Fe transport